MFTRLYTHHFFRHHEFYDREVYENILKDPKSSIGRKLNFLIQISVIIGVLSIILETVGDWGAKYEIAFFIVDALVSFIFVGEYLYRFLRAKSKKFFVFRPMNIIDFISFAPFFLSLMFAPFGGLAVLRVLRILRTLRLFEVSSKSPIALGFMRTLKQYKQEYKGILGIFTTCLVIFSTFVHYFESGVNADFASIPHTLWWGVVTMTTVGYGDMVPITLGGKLFGAVLVILGPILLAVISSITILVFMDVAEGHKQSLFKSCAKCRTRNDDEAIFCKYCGNKHFLSNIMPEERKKLPFLDKLFTRK